MQREQPRSVLPIALLGLLVVVGLFWWGARERGTPTAASRATGESTRRGDGDDTADTRQAMAGVPPTGPTAGSQARPLELPETPWAAVDLDRIREAMPDNLYWKMSVPTKDEAILRERAEERARWNVEYGKVLSNTATAEEIDAYYALQHRLSSDYVEFATYLLVEFGDKLPTQDVGLLKVAIQLNLARLEEIPRHIADAHERRKVHDAARRAWLEEQKAFDQNR